MEDSTIRSGGELTPHGCRCVCRYVTAVGRATLICPFEAEGCNDCRLGGGWTGGLVREYRLSATDGRSAPIRVVIAVLI